MMKLGPRVGDGAEMCILELVNEPVVPKKKSAQPETAATDAPIDEQSDESETGTESESAPASSDTEPTASAEKAEAETEAETKAEDTAQTPAAEADQGPPSPPTRLRRRKRSGQKTKRHKRPEFNHCCTPAFFNLETAGLCRSAIRPSGRR